MENQIEDQDLTEDTVKKTIEEYSTKLLEKGSEAFEAIAEETQSLATDAANRGAAIKSILANLDTLNTSVYQQLSGLDASKFDVQIQAAVNAAKSELGKAEGFFRGQFKNSVRGC